MEKKMLRIAVAFIVFVCSSAALALVPMGPPMSTLKERDYLEGQFSIGFHYCYSEVDIELSGHGVSERIDDIESNMIFANLAYGISGSCDVFLRLGAANAEVEGVFGDYEFAWGLGTKATFVHDGDLIWGGVFQIHWIESKDSWAFGGYSGDAEIHAHEIQVGAGPTWQGDGFSLYGGPFFHYINGDVDIKLAGETVSFDIEQESEFGGFVGAQWELAEKAFLYAEGQFTGDAWGFGVGGIWKIP